MILYYTLYDTLHGIIACRTAHFYLSVYVIKASTLFFYYFVRILKLNVYHTPLHAIHHLILFLFPIFPLFLVLILPLFFFLTFPLFLFLIFLDIFIFQSHHQMNYRQRLKRTASYNYSILHSYHFSPRRWPHTILRLPLGEDPCNSPRH